MVEIDFAKIERKWQKRWADAGVFEAKGDDPREARNSAPSKKGTKVPASSGKFYVLEMFPYPSGEGLHMGHALNYTIGDVLARFKRMNGFNILYPMGFDSLGLPAENAAIKAGEHPDDYTRKAVVNYTRQMKELGLSYDWSKTLSSMEPEYYKWNQLFFLKFLEKGLAYKKKSPVNWCSKCDTVLANEQVHDGKCWRHDEVDVETKHLEQWFLKTTDYADELLSCIDGLEWPEKIKIMQKNWIGRSEGTEIEFKISDEAWKVFTTRPDTIFGATFMVVSAQHEKLGSLVTSSQKKDVKRFLKKIKSVSEKDTAKLDKEGVFTGSYAINPANGEKVPIWVGNFVLADYGSGMVMGVPAHDKRDFDFAKKYEIEIKEVVSGGDVLSGAYVGEGALVNSGKFDGMDNVEAKEKIREFLGAKKVVNFKLRDWGISRQRYWGTPIPIVYCEKCGMVPVPEKDLPVELPYDVKFGKGNPLETNKEFVNTKCPKCGKAGKRETETMDTFVDSSWYFMRYPDPHNNKVPFDKKIEKYWLPCDQYIGGVEHATMHLLYARFWTKALRDLGYVDFDEPFTRLFNQGMLNGTDGKKMSKSKGNVINPDEVSRKYGMDTARYFLLSLAAPDKPRDWSEKGIMGSSRFIRKIISFFENHAEGKDNAEVLSKLNESVRDITKYYDSFDYRKATIVLKELFDLLIAQEGVSKNTMEVSLKLLSPICPHISEELWEKRGNKGFVSNSPWPEADKSKIEKKSEGMDLNSKIIERVKGIIKKDTKKIYVYVMPFEMGEVDAGRISKEVGREVKVFGVNDSEKFDPEGRAKKAKPGMASVYLE